MFKGAEFIDINNLINEIQILSTSNNFEKIKNIAFELEKNILDNCKNDYELKTLIDDLTIYSDYTVLNTLLVKYQYPNFLSLKTKEYYNERGIELLENAKPIKILRPIVEEFVSIKYDNSETIKNVSELTKKEMKQYRNQNNENITFHHKEFRGLNIIELYDVKDTTMKKEDYNFEPLPALFYSSYDDIYNSFVKAIYTAGYKIKYKKMEDKFSFDKDDKVISLQKGLNNRVHLLSVLNIYVKDNSSNDMEEELLEFVICRRLGIEKDDIDFNKFNKWYHNQDIKDVDRLLKVVVNRGRKLVDNFNRFYDLELKANMDISSPENDMEDDFIFSL